MIESGKHNNVFTIFLSLLNIRYTEKNSNKLFNQHPHKNNLYGISKMLFDYNIDNAGTVIEDKDSNIHNIQTPFIAHYSGEFANVYNVEDEYVYFYWMGQKEKLSISQFCNSWSGVILLAETSPNSEEPNYKENRKLELFDYLQKTSLLLSVMMLVAIAFIINNIYMQGGLSMLLLLNFVGVYISYLLVKKQINIHDKYADKICSLFKQNDCNDVLASDAAKFLGRIGWSEVGLGYFISNICILLFFPQFIAYFSIINICSLPYTFWSVWYQKVRAKQWCPLCLIVQFLLWSIFVVNIIFNNIYIPELSIINAIIIACIYFIPIVTFNILVPNISKGGLIENITYEINSIKSDNDVFLTQLKKQANYQVNKLTSSIVFGNPDGDILVTIFTNPHCNPCTKMHFRVEKLLQQTNNICIQYIFSSFDESLDSSNKFLIDVYLNNPIHEVMNLYNEWFESGKRKKDDFFIKYKRDGFDSNNTIEEFNKHQKWKKDTGLMATPTILINGYKLPENFKIEDLLFYSKL